MDSTAAATSLNIIAGRGLPMASTKSVCFSEGTQIRNYKLARPVYHDKTTV